MAYKDFGNKMEGIIVGVVGLLLSVVGIVITLRVFATQLPSLKDAASSITENITDPGWGSTLADDVAASGFGELVPFVILAAVVIAVFVIVGRLRMSTTG